MVTRLNGFSGTGIDIDDTVKKLMMAARMPQDKLKQQKQSIEWQRDDYRTINSKIMAFRDLAFNMKLQSSYQSKKATSTDESSVSVTGTSVATPGNYSLQVDKLASAATATSGLLGATVKGADTKVSDIVGALTPAKTFASNTLLTIGGSKGTTSIEVKPTDTLGSLVSSINSKSSITGVNVSYDATIDKLFFTSTSTGKAGQVNLSAKNVAGNTADLLTDVLKISGGTPQAGTTISGTNNFAGSLQIDSSLKSTQTLRIKIGSTTADFTIDKDTTYDKLISDINKSAISTTEGAKAYLDSNNNLKFKDAGDNPVTATLSDQNDDTTKVNSKLTTPAPNLDVPTSTLIDRNLTTTKQLRVKVGSASVDISIDKTTTIANVIDAINSSAVGKLGVSAYLDSNHNIVFSNPTTDSITLTDEKDSAANVLPQFKMSSTTTPATFNQVKKEGTQAEVQFNGAIAKYDTNSFTINGINFTAKKTTSSAVDVNVIGDTDSIYNNIKNFIDKYNELIDTINTKVNEKKYRDYTPLTDSQRESMKDDQITAWEAKAKSGTLRGDMILNQALTNLRSSFSSPITGLPSGSAKSLSEIGISTSVTIGGAISGSYLDNGKIYIDDNKLKKAIAENPDQVMALFVSDDKLKESTAGDGVATRLNNLASSLIGKITARAGISNSVDTSYTLGKSTKELNKRIDDWTTKLDALQTRYYNQFTAMEKYITQMQAQSAQLTQQMGG
ncbi:flagellar filament capping protein FliD [Paenibacillus planticolens]|uniref:Flagellar hook-associated protein 2 n=1 Tax=Paenibacillus planticolens TaxID=2654976 RepID=A0ABX1ZK33_9BACL|nr:flagellar filament capping protein FliD [Paenibacillus planticolens]NOV00459.1 flagellar filament capping protein FliD [Paenibacillus planticolens]